MNLGTIITRSVRYWPDHIAVADCQARLTYAEFAQGNLGPGRPGYGYRNYCYQKDDGDSSVEASGRFGQKIYINPRREVGSRSG